MRSLGAVLVPVGLVLLVLLAGCAPRGPDAAGGPDEHVSVLAGHSVDPIAAST